MKKSRKKANKNKTVDYDVRLANIKRKVKSGLSSVCLRCLTKTTDAHVIHIFSKHTHPELQYNPDNMVVLCKKCSLKYFMSFKERDDRSLEMFIGRSIFSARKRVTERIKEYADKSRIELEDLKAKQEFYRKKVMELDNEIKKAKE